VKVSDPKTSKKLKEIKISVLKDVLISIDKLPNSEINKKLKERVELEIKKIDGEKI